MPTKRLSSDNPAVAPGAAPPLTLSGRSAQSIAADAVVLVVGSTESGPRLLGADLPAATLRRLRAVLKPLGVTGAVDQVIRVPADESFRAPVLVLTGVGRLAGPRSRPTAEALRQAVGAATRTLKGVDTVALTVPADDDDTLAAVCEGALLGAYSYDRYRGSGTEQVDTRRPAKSVVVLADRARSRQRQRIAQRAQALADAVHLARDLVNAPPQDLFPQSFAEAAQAAVQDLPVTVKVLDERQLSRGGYGGLLGVGQGSSRPPRLVRLTYSPAKAQAHLAFVGKGITFDSGGLSLKPPTSMITMKNDMSGAASVLAALTAIARLSIPVKVEVWLALAENMPSGTAQRPSDVLTMRGGKTVEVLNTDAEGRLVLADALVDASASRPDVIVDVATLTGAQVVALGNRVSGVMSNDDALRDRMHRVATDCGEQIWPMPLPSELRASLDSPIADLANIGDRSAGMLVAGVFLSEFVGSAPGEDGEARQIPWAHLDIAGPAFTDSAFGYASVGGTGVPVRTLVRLAEDLAGDTA